MHADSGSGPFFEQERMSGHTRRLWLVGSCQETALPFLVMKHLYVVCMLHISYVYIVAYMLVPAADRSLRKRERRATPDGCSIAIAGAMIGLLHVFLSRIIR